MARYRLLSQHYSEEDKLLEAGTEVGDGTGHAWTRRPTAEMEPLDPEGVAALEKERERAAEHGITWGRIAPIDDLPLTTGEADAKYEREVIEARTEASRRTGSTRAAGQTGRPTAATLADYGKR